MILNVKRFFPQFAYLPRIYHLIWESTGRWTVLWGAIVIVLGLLPPITIALTKLLVDSIVAAARAKGSWQSVRPVLITGILMALAAVLIDLLQGISEWVRTTQTEMIQDHVSALIHRKSIEVDFGFYESPEYYDRLYRARDDAHTRILNLLEHLGSVCQNGITLIALTVIVATYNPLLLIAMLLSVAPAFMIVVRYNWLTHQWWITTTVERRWIQYYDQKLTSAASAAEMRLFQLGSHFQSAYRALRGKLRESHLDLIKRQNVARLGASVAGVVVSGASIGWIGWRTLLGRATFGDLALFYQAFLGGQGFMRVVTLSLGQVYNNSLFLGNLFDFLDLKTKISNPDHPVAPPSALRDGIQFNNVKFRYPGSERIALHSLDLFIPAGKIVAIVGPNGAGKSTLIKLLSRFYDPDSGSITLDGVDLRDLALPELRSLFSILFQVPVSYDASAAENIAIGDLSATPTAAAIQQAAVRSGAHPFISRLPDGYDTLLGKSFADGTDLSSGEWQRVAMARAFLRQSPIILLDEPTSFMDSWAEVDWFKRLRSLSKGRTAMIVTHRFTIAMRADLIHVMENGRLVESGKHGALLERGGLYAQSWRDQMLASSGQSMADGALATVLTESFEEAV